MKIFKPILGILLMSSIIGCETKNLENSTPPSESKIKIMALDPGHFHAGLIHKTMYPEIDSTIYVFAPEGPELKDYLNRIAGYNERNENPTAWNINLEIGPDYLDKMIKSKPGNVMMVAGKNDLKIDYITAAIENGINVYADKPLVINSQGFKKLINAFASAKQKNLMLYDIMTERYEISTILQRELSLIPEVFGTLEDGTLENPAITKESVHHFFKYVSGQALIRPDWFFDVEQEGDGIVDVTTHLVDLIQWEVFPEEILDTTQVQMLSAKRWATELDLNQFKEVTGKSEFPDFLQKDLKNDKLQVFSNGEMNYTLKGKHAKISVIWNYQAPEGTGDTHYSMMRGTKADLIIRQGKEENYKPSLYVKLHEAQFESLEKAIQQTLQSKFPGLTITEQSSGEYLINIPESYHVGHEAHFAQVTERFLEYMKAGKMPDWEVPNMIVKYFTTTQALEKAMEK
ncbi:putative oxidoreductase C-terminal domain-containing protein [Algoriphagus marinus]|uniref:putative oxidoreductase C-terminal domain-containing protein n=1 Tax=Algoriphagus marinus TaxID=1925762 RepID=UPI00094BC0F2|nr:putative oxidoreductase C-terminal domain-containing protein [Algoriphagus marinus]